MAIKAIINNTEKEIEQIKDSDEQDVDYVYSRIGDTEAEGEPPISIKSIGGNLADYRIYGQTVDGESVGDRTGNLFYKKIENANISFNGGIYSDNYDLWIGKVIAGETYTAYNTNLVVGFFTDEPNYGRYTYNSSRIVDASTVYTFTVPSDCSYVAIRFLKNATRAMLNLGDTPLPYEPYGYKVPVTVEGKNLFYITKFTNGNTQSTSQGVNFSIIDNEVYANGTSTGMYPQVIGFDFVVTEWETYAATLYIEGEYTGLPYIYCTTDYDSTGNYKIVRPNVRTIFTALPNTRFLFVTQRTGESFNIKYKLLITKATIEDDTYEPYQPPVTTNLYLPEQIKKVGDEAEYIDYGEQKQHRVRKNLVSSYLVENKRERYANTLWCEIDFKPNTEYILDFIYAAGAQFYTNEYVFETVKYTNALGGKRSLKLKTKSTIDKNSGNQYVANKGWIILKNNIDATEDIEISDIQIRLATIEDDTYEPYIENTDLDVTLPTLSAIKGTNVLSVETSIQPSNMYIKDNFDYKKVFTATRVIEDELPLNYRSIEDNDSALSNYRIYGQTSRNLFDMKKFAETCNQISATVNYINNTLTFTATNVDAYVNTAYKKGVTIYIADRPSCIDVLPSTTYTISMSSAPKCYISWINSSYEVVSAYAQIPANQSSYTFTTPEDCTKLLIRLGKGVTNIGDTFTISNIMLNLGLAPIPYEPYGESVGDLVTSGEHAGEYKVPVTVSNDTDALTTPIYLPEQIKKVGDEAEYIDYGEQKQHRVRKNLFDMSTIVKNKYINSSGVEIRSDAEYQGNKLNHTDFINVSNNTAYSFTCVMPYSILLDNVIAFCWFDNNKSLISRNTNPIHNTNLSDYSFSAISPLNVTYLIINFIGYVDGTTYMLNKGSTALPYEPYIENTDLDVTLPALPTLTGTNTLTIGTEVQPSSVEIKGHIK